MGVEAQSVSPEPAVFRTAFGSSIYQILLFCFGFIALTLVPSDVQESVPYVGAFFGGLGQACLAAAAILTVYTMLSTKYRVVDGVLHLHQGPFNRCIDLEAISRISLKSAMLSGTKGYGMGTRRVHIYYRLGVYRDRAVWVTPKDVDCFLAAIGARRTAAVDIEVTR